MPELPEVEITARRLDEALRGAVVQSALAPGLNALKTFDPPLQDLAGRRLESVRRRGKHFIVDVEGDLALLIHLMSAGRLQLFDTHAGPRDRTSRLLVRLADTPSGVGAGRELRLREFGTKQAAWVKLLTREALEQRRGAGDPGTRGLAGPAAARGRSRRGRARCIPCCATSASSPASGAPGSTRSCGRAACRPSSAVIELDAAERAALREAIAPDARRRAGALRSGGAAADPRQAADAAAGAPARGEPCPRCGTTLAAVHFEDYVIAYCPACQTGGRVLKDRRLSRLLK